MACVRTIQMTFPHSVKQVRHHPLHAGDPSSFPEERSWMARMKRAMTVFWLKERVRFTA
jgi:hypothetical protein